MTAVDTAAPPVDVGRPRRRLATPPGRLRLLSILVAAMLVALWAAAFTTVRVRQHATHALAGTHVAAVVAAESLRADLAAADAAAARELLPGATVPAAVRPDPRTAYQRAVADAGARIVELARVGHDAGAPGALTVLSQRLPEYAGQVELARAYTRLGSTVGGAYLRSGSALMRAALLPAADRLVTAEAARVDRDSRRASGALGPLVVAAAGLVSVAMLVVVQIRLFRRTNRILNPALVAATLLAAIAVGWALTAFAVQRAHLLDARDQGFRPLTAAGQARALGLRAWADENLALISPADAAAHDADADAATLRLGYDPGGDLVTAADPATGPTTGSAPPGLLAGLTVPAGLEGPAAPLGPVWQVHQTNAAQVRAHLDEPGGLPTALALLQGPDTIAFHRFDQASAAVVAAASGRLTGHLTQAGAPLRSLPAALSLSLGLAAVLTLVGIQVRINDYRQPRGHHPDGG
ncbi:conserved membrane hypothetical protein [Frankia canadensis]|uniref:Secreted protein n=1 Tax=Frankia canadensis TaxID=1836972 RepID=A0A2I2KUG9_9ACTN|nr:hypothetical protein [Frankia canadensis]SNQ49302.1 conserved membrane hypothetical protein [Frankia canadensis]SOU56592.1 conserved membrane hypothetical protein [Frankia canadensis]